MRPSERKVENTTKSAIFPVKFTSWPIKLNTYMYETKFTSHKQYLFSLFFSVNVK